MRNNRNLVFGILALLVGITAITFAYAGFTQTLNITGQGKVVSSKWDIHFNNLSSPTLTKTAAVTTAPTITSGTTIGNYAVRLMTPGDSVSYTFDVVNDGDFNATLTTLTKNTPTCSGGNSTNVCNNLTYTLVYASNNAAVAQNDTLNVGETKTMKLTLTFNNSNSTSVLPTSDITVSNLGITLLYSQSSLFTIAPTPAPSSGNYVYTISEDEYIIGGAAPSLQAGTTVATEEEMLILLQSKASNYLAFIRHTVDGSGNITESYVGFTNDAKTTTYYLKGYDTSAYSNNQGVLTSYCGSPSLSDQGTSSEHYYCSSPIVEAYASGRVYFLSGGRTYGWKCVVASDGFSYCLNGT